MTDTDHIKTYNELTAQLQQLRERHAVAASREEAKAVERAKLIAELTQAGVDVNNLPAELQRLESEMKTELANMSAAINQFAVDLTQAEQAQAAIASNVQES